MDAAPRGKARGEGQILDSSQPSQWQKNLLKKLESRSEALEGPLEAKKVLRAGSSAREPRTGLQRASPWLWEGILDPLSHAIRKATMLPPDHLLRPLGPQNQAQKSAVNDPVL